MDSKIVEELANALNLTCLSDLSSVSSVALNKAISKIGFYNYSIKQWNYALSYVSGKTIDLKNINEVELFIKNM